MLTKNHHFVLCHSYGKSTSLCSCMWSTYSMREPISILESANLRHWLQNNKWSWIWDLEPASRLGRVKRSAITNCSYLIYSVYFVIGTFWDIGISIPDLKKKYFTVHRFLWSWCEDFRFWSHLDHWHPNLAQVNHQNTRKIWTFL